LLADADESCVSMLMPQFYPLPLAVPCPPIVSRRKDGGIVQIYCQTSPPRTERRFRAARRRGLPAGSRGTPCGSTSGACLDRLGELLPIPLPCRDLRGVAGRVLFVPGPQQGDGGFVADADGRCRRRLLEQARRIHIQRLPRRRRLLPKLCLNLAGNGNAQCHTRVLLARPFYPIGAAAPIPPPSATARRRDLPNRPVSVPAPPSLRLDSAIRTQHSAFPSPPSPCHPVILETPPRQRRPRRRQHREPKRFLPSLRGLAGNVIAAYLQIADGCRKETDRWGIKLSDSASPFAASRLFRTL